MKNLFCVILVVLVGHRGMPQSIFTSNEIKRGIYKDFNEFITNTPSLSFDNKIWIDEGEMDLLDNYERSLFVYKGSEVRLPIYRLKNRVNNSRLDTKDFWGYCDGTKFYINSYTHIPRNYFVQLLLVGRYCYFLQIDPNSNSSPPSTTPINTNGIAEYIVNVNNGKIFRLDRKLLKVILQDDTELLNELNADKEVKHKLLIEYIERYNDRHMHEIKITK